MIIHELLSPGLLHGQLGCLHQEQTISQAFRNKCQKNAVITKVYRIGAACHHAQISGMGKDASITPTPMHSVLYSSLMQSTGHSPGPASCSLSSVIIFLLCPRPGLHLPADCADRHCFTGAPDPMPAAAGVHFAAEIGVLPGLQQSGFRETPSKPMQARASG